MAEELTLDIPEAETITAPDAPEIEAPEIEAPEAPEEEGEQAGEAPPQPPAAPDAPIKDGDVVKWLREQAKATPEHSKLFNSLRDNYFRAQEFSRLFPEVNEARTLKTHLDAIGGMDGLNELQSISNDMSELYTAIDSGDPAVIEDIAQNSRDGFIKLVPHALETLYRTDQNAYNELLRPIISSTLLNSPIVDSVALAMDRLQRGETDAALRELTRIQQTFETLRGGGGANAPRAGAGGGAYAPVGGHQGPPPAAEAGLNPMVAQIQPVIEQFLERTIQSDAQAALGTRQLAAPAMQRLSGLVKAEIDRTLGSDTAYQARIQALLRSGNAERTRQFIQANVDQVRPRVVRQILTEMYGSQPGAGSGAQQRRAAPPQQRAAGGTRPPVAEGVVNLTRPPRQADIDWSRTDTTAMIAHRAILKDGRSVRWPFKSA